MEQDLRDLIKKDASDEQTKMSLHHEARFLEKLEKALPKNNRRYKNYGFLNIAAGLVILIGLSFGAYQFFQETETNEPQTIVNNEIKTLGDVSPDLKKVEDYYLASINLELSNVSLTPENKELFDGYIQRLQELDEEYTRLTIELTENGPNEDTLNALIDNLKFRLNFVMRLKDKLQEFNKDAFVQEQV